MTLNGQITDLANLMRSRKKDDRKFVLMLGAGASMSSGVPSTPTIMQDLLKDYGSGIPDGSIENRFDALWRRSTPADRRMYLRPYLDLSPSSGYAKLAQLIRAEYFDVVITFNFDQLLEKALQRLELEFKAIIRGETIDDKMHRLIESSHPRTKVAKLHGSLGSTDHFLFAADEMDRYPAPIETMMKDLTGGDIIICGYAFNDDCVKSAFAEEGGLVVCVDPGGIPRKLRRFAERRQSLDWAVSERFDAFFEALHAQLLPPPPPPPAVNPFKFLESYEFEDAEMLTGRAPEIERFVKQMQMPSPPRILIFSGPGQSGKTSLAKAALVPALGALQHRAVYLRCRKDAASTLPRDIAAILTEPGKPAVTPAADLATALRQLVAATTGRVVVLLDQFDRLISRDDASPLGRDEIAVVLREQIFPALGDRLTLVLLVTDEGSLAGQLVEVCQYDDVYPALLLCRPFEKPGVIGIINALAAKAGIVFDPFIVNDLAERYHSTRNQPPARRFSLAHVQAVCYLLISTPGLPIETYRTFERNFEALYHAINVCDMISFVEDFAWSEAEQLRNIIKVPLLESKERIAEFVKLHYEELLARAAAQRRGRV